MQIHSEESWGCSLKLDNSSILLLSVSQLSNLPIFSSRGSLLRFNRFRYFSKIYWLKMKCEKWLTFSWFSSTNRYPFKQLSKLWWHRPFFYSHWLPWCAVPVQSAASSTKPEMPSSWKVTTFLLCSNNSGSLTFETRPPLCTAREFS